MIEKRREENILLILVRQKTILEPPFIHINTIIGDKLSYLVIKEKTLMYNGDDKFHYIVNHILI